MVDLIVIGLVLLSIPLSSYRFQSYPFHSYHLPRLHKTTGQQQRLHDTLQPIYVNETSEFTYTKGTSSIVKTLRKLTYYKVCPLSDSEKQVLFEDFTASAGSLSFQDISNCIWNMGLIGFKVNAVANQTSIDTMMAALRSSVASLEEEEEDIEEYMRPPSALPPSHSLLRLIGGLEKVGILWDRFPSELRHRYLGTLNTKMTDEALGREVATLVWTLGRLGASLADLPQEDQVTLWRRIYLVTLSSSLTPQGLAMLINGLAKLGTRWELVQDDIRHRLALKVAESDLNAAETCSVITSLASMGADWNTLESETSESLVRHISRHAADLSGREISNILWSLGQLRLNFTSIMAANSQEQPPSELDEDWREEEQEMYAVLEMALCERLRDRAPSLSAYDLESALSGLAHTSVSEGQLSTILQDLTPHLLSRFADKSSNSFFCVRVLSSLSLMPVRLAGESIHTRSGATPFTLDATLETALVDYALQMFHVFNGRQFPTVLLSLSRLGLSVDRLTAFQRGRLMAVLSRVLMSLDAEGVVASLLALQRMGFIWSEHFVPPSQSQPNNPATTEPLGGRVLAYVRSNIGSFREVDLSLLLFALGQLGLDWSSVGESFERKVSNRLGKVARFLPVHRAALTFRGLELMKVDWAKLPANATQPLDAALPNIFSETSGENLKADLAALLTSAKAIGMASFPQHAAVEAFLSELTDASLVAATQSRIAADSHMQSLLQKYAIQVS